MEDRTVDQLLALLHCADASDVICADIYGHTVGGDLEAMAANGAAFSASPLRWQAGVGRVEYDRRRFRNAILITRGELVALVAASAANETFDP